MNIGHHRDYFYFKMSPLEYITIFHALRHAHADLDTFEEGLDDRRVPGHIKDVIIPTLSGLMNCSILRNEEGQATSWPGRFLGGS